MGVARRRDGDRSSRTSSALYAWGIDSAGAFWSALHPTRREMIGLACGPRFPDGNGRVQWRGRIWFTGLGDICSCFREMMMAKWVELSLSPRRPNFVCCSIEYRSRLLVQWGRSLQVRCRSARSKSLMPCHVEYFRMPFLPAGWGFVSRVTLECWNLIRIV
jgi:hypothetical protein